MSRSARTAQLEPLLSVAEVGAILRKSPKTLYNWRSAGKGPRGFKVGGNTVYRPRDVVAWIAEQADRSRA